MPPESQLTDDQKALFKPLEPKEGASPETEVTPPVVNGEEVLTVEEFRAKYPNVRIKTKIAGQEVVAPPEEFVNYRQRYDGLERTSERKAQEMARVLAEVKSEIANIKTTATPPAEPKDPNDPTVFVEGIVDARLGPKIAALEQRFNQYVSLMEPEIENAQIKRAKRILALNDVDPSDFDQMRDSIINHFERKLGKTLDERELGQISGDQWAVGYSFAKLNSIPKAPVEPKPQEKIVVQRTNAPSGGGGGYPRTEAIGSKELDDAIRTNDFSGLIAKHIKPRPQGE